MLNNIEAYIDSKEFIKPSTPTPDDKKIQKLCMMDQFMAPFYTQLISFHKASEPRQEKLSRLKKSLSETLTVFYPLAGRIKDNTSIDCNDEGVLFVEARVDCRLEDFLKEPNTRFLHHFLACAKVPTERTSEIILVAMQVTFFTCGGFAIGGCFNHKVMDGASLRCFMKYWVSHQHGHQHEVDYPDFTAASKLFPPRECISSFQAEFLSTPADKKCTFKRYLFNPTAVQALKVKSRSEKVPNPSRSEVVSAFLWKHTMSTKGKSSFLTQLVNLRARAPSLIPRGTMGCLFLPMTAKVDLAIEKDQEMDVLVCRIREAISKLDFEYVKRVQGEDGTEMIWRSMETNFYDRATVFICTSLFQFGFPGLDYGWGKPVWVSPCGDTPSLAEWHSITLLDAPDDKGVEAWFVLQEHEVAKLEHDQEFLAYATPVTGILN